MLVLSEISRTIDGIQRLKLHKAHAFLLTNTVAFIVRVRSIPIAQGFSKGALEVTRYNSLRNTNIIGYFSVSVSQLLYLSCPSEDPTALASFDSFQYICLCRTKSQATKSGAFLDSFSPRNLSLDQTTHNPLIFEPPTSGRCPI